jgi:hypothetical protein
MKNLKRVTGLGILLASGLASAQDVKVSGFVAPTFGFARKFQTLDSSTFAIADGAVYLGASHGASELLVDLPFAYSSGKDLSVGTGKAQAYVKHKWENGLNVKFGQFDTPFGYEANDLANVTFTHQGIVYEALPVVHTGLTLGYDLSDMLGVSFIFANPFDNGVKLPKSKFDIGAHVSSKVDALNLGLGFLYTDGVQTLFDVTAGTAVQGLDVAADVAIKMPDTGDSSFFFGLQGKKGLTEELTAGARFEFGRVPAGAGSSTEFELTVGPQYALSKALVAKLDYSFLRASGTTGHLVAASAVYSF